jgi:hypothetical protein
MCFVPHNIIKRERLLASLAHPARPFQENIHALSHAHPQPPSLLPFTAHLPGLPASVTIWLVSVFPISSSMPKNTAQYDAYLNTISIYIRLPERFYNDSLKIFSVAACDHDDTTIHRRMDNLNKLC